MERICINQISSGYLKRIVLSDISFSALPGQCIGIVGVNGSGKTTLFQILSGLKKAENGTITFDGILAEGNVGKELFRKYVGYVPQEDNLISELKVYDNLFLWYQSPEKIERALTMGFLHVLGIEEMLHQKVRNLSMGMKKKVSIACALADNPSILLLDEPDASLDLISKVELSNYLSLYKQSGGTVIMATHEESLLDVCDKVYTLSKGKNIEIERLLRGNELMQQIKASASISL